MKKILLLPILLISITCLSQSKKTDVYLKQGGEIAKDYTQCKIEKSKRCNWGFETTLVSDSGRYVIYYRERLKPDSCYYVANYLIKKK